MSKKSITTASPAFDLIGPGMEITGDIISNRDVRVEGTINGSVSSKGKLIISKTGKVKGEINCKNFDLSGKIEGRITVGELLSLKSSAIVEGEIISSKISIDEGAIFTGKCNMSVSESAKVSIDFKKEAKDSKAYKKS